MGLSTNEMRGSPRQRLPARSPPTLPGHTESTQALVTGAFKHFSDLKSREAKAGGGSPGLQTNCLNSCTWLGQLSVHDSAYAAFLGPSMQGPKAQSSMLCSKSLYHCVSEPQQCSSSHRDEQEAAHVSAP